MILSLTGVCLCLPAVPRKLGLVSRFSAMFLLILNPTTCSMADEQADEKAIEAQFILKVEEGPSLVA